MSNSISPLFVDNGKDDSGIKTIPDASKGPKYGKYAYILCQQYRRTKLYVNLGRVNYGLCVEYKVA